MTGFAKNKKIMRKFFQFFQCQNSRSHPASLSVWLSLFIYSLCLSLPYLPFLSSYTCSFPNALPYLHTYTLLFNAVPWVYSLPRALPPSICLENFRNTTRNETWFMCVSLQMGQFKWKRMWDNTWRECKSLFNSEQPVNLRHHFSRVSCTRHKECDILCW